jgi:manganese transport system ATP-binding protein
VCEVLVEGDAVAGRDLVIGHGQAVAVASSSFTIPEGAVTTVIGPNGSGKSTLLNAIAGLLPPISGSLEVAAREGGPGRIAYVLQHTKVNDSLPVTVREVVTMGRYARVGGYGLLARRDREAVNEAMERTGTSGIGARHLHELSGGQRQRVFVAQGLAQDHDLLLLDEPLTGIDLTTAQAIDSVIHDERTRGCTIVVATHDLSEAQVADHVLLLSGRVVASGPPDRVLTAENLAEAYGASLLHVDEGRIFLDDPAHRPARVRRQTRKTIHTESSPSDLHGSVDH